MNMCGTLLNMFCDALIICFLTLLNMFCDTALKMLFEAEHGV